MSKAELDVRLPAFDDALEALHSPGADVASDEPYWAAVRGLDATSQEPANLENAATSTRAKIRETSTPAKIRETGKTLEATRPKRTTNQWNIRVPVTGRMQ